MQLLTGWLVYATRIVTEWLFIYSVLEGSVSFSVTDCFSVCDTRWVVVKGGAYLAFELTQQFPSITDIQVRSVVRCEQVSEVYSTVFCIQFD